MGPPQLDGGIGPRISRLLGQKPSLKKNYEI